jgi:hypothetical protein
MPSLAGLTLAGAAARAAAIGLHIASAEDLNLPTTPTATPASPQPTTSSTTPSATSTEPVAHAVSSIGTVIAQTPAAGHRVVKGDAVHITLTD